MNVLPAVMTPDDGRLTMYETFVLVGLVKIWFDARLVVDKTTKAPEEFMYPFTVTTEVGIVMVGPVSVR